VSKQFELVREVGSSELDGVVRTYRHARLGTEALHIKNSDKNKVFCLVFPTLHNSSDGTPHILEHVVLGGSKRYPLKDPFFEKSKSSLATYLNAFTGMDYTAYPVACENNRDFLNLVDLYTDSLFAPLLTETVFKREGHMLKINENGELTYSGIVFNEMKGMFANVNYLFHKLARKALFPDTAYAKMSGGDPENIPSLTYQAFKQFYQDRYHPSLCKVLIYGDLEPAEIFERLEGYFKNYQPRSPVVYDFITQSPENIKPYFEAHYPATDDGAADEKDRHVAVCWALPEARDAFDAIRMTFIFNLLVGSSGAPLRKAISESGLAATPVGELDDDSIPIPVFSAGAHQIRAQDIDKLVALIDATIQAVAKDGFAADLIEAEFANFEFGLRELANSADRGINIVTGLAVSFLRGEDPIDELSFEKHLAALKAEISKGQSGIKASLRAWLVENKLRAVTVLAPDKDFQSKRDVKERAELAALQAKLSKDQIQKIDAAAKMVEEAVAADDPPEALAAMPSLTLADLDREEKEIKFNVMSGKPRFIHVPQSAHGICYTQVALDVGKLKTEDLPYLGLFLDLVHSVGTAEFAYDKFSTVVGTDTGGISARLMIAEHFKTGELILKVILGGRALEAKRPRIIELSMSALRTARLDDKARVKQVLLERRSGMERGLVSASMRYAMAAASAPFTVASLVSDRARGLSFLRELRWITDNFETEWPSLLTRLETIRKELVASSISHAQVVSVEPHQVLDAWSECFKGSASATPKFTFAPPALRRGFVISSQVNYNAQVRQLSDTSVTAGTAYVAAKMVSEELFLEKIRLQGGAYGGSSNFSAQRRLWMFGSHRDPHVAKTFEVFKEAGSWLSALDLSELELERSVIGLIGGRDEPLSVESQASAAFQGEIVGRTHRDNQIERDEIFAATVNSITNCGEIITKTPKSTCAIFGNLEALKAFRNAGQLDSIEDALTGALLP
jgi:Zn-dependent M16 (insulinase) family peptidase